MAESSYDLLELCDAADVTPRTVRYYVQQGLLPSPDARGRGTKYDRAHLERIRLIKRLQARHLPLAEIRTQLADLSDATVSVLVAEPGADTKSESALSYVRNVLAGTKSESESEIFEKRLAALAVHSQHASTPPVMSAPSSASPPMREPFTHPRSTWDRIPLAPDIELHVRRPLSRVQNKLLDRLIQHARSLFSDPS
ncbi:MAG: MerR family transcriptional regulator [Gemmatimonadota bacterium]